MEKRRRNTETGPSSKKQHVNDEQHFTSRSSSKHTSPRQPATKDSSKPTLKPNKPGTNINNDSPESSQPTHYTRSPITQATDIDTSALAELNTLVLLTEDIVIDSRSQTPDDIDITDILRARGQKRDNYVRASWFECCMCEHPVFSRTTHCKCGHECCEFCFAKQFESS
jgi:hypothetical protein